MSICKPGGPGGIMPCPLGTPCWVHCCLPGLAFAGARAVFCMGGPRAGMPLPLPLTSLPRPCRLVVSALGPCCQDSGWAAGGAA